VASRQFAGDIEPRQDRSASSVKKHTSDEPQRRASVAAARA